MKLGETVVSIGSRLGAEVTVALGSLLNTDFREYADSVGQTGDGAFVTRIVTDENGSQKHISTIRVTDAASLLEASPTNLELNGNDRIDVFVKKRNGQITAKLRF